MSVENNGLRFQPIVIIGAPRSGTNMLRDVLTRLPSIGTWPCDEINYVWRHGNIRYPSDELPVSCARPNVRRYVREQFTWVARRYGSEVVVEKTCANALRVGFVDRIVPEARYIVIRRDGLDAVGSALKRWRASVDWSYVMRKARFVPSLDLPYYASRYLWNRCYRMFAGGGRLAFWGPKLNGMEQLLARYALEEVCALQWQRSVESSAEALSSMPSDKYVEVGYEAFVGSPEIQLRRILDFLGRSAADDEITSAVASVNSASVGRGRHELGRDAAKRVQSLVGDTLRRYGYAA